MGKYRVKVIQMALRNNKVAKSGDLVSESQLTGNAADLESKGFIETVSDKKKSNSSDADKAKKAAEKEAAEKEAAEKAYIKAYDEGLLSADQLDSITMDEIYKYAKKHSLKYDEKSKKEDLIQDVLKAEKA